MQVFGGCIDYTPQGFRFASLFDFPGRMTKGSKVYYGVLLFDENTTYTYQHTDENCNDDQVNMSFEDFKKIFEGYYWNYAILTLENSKIKNLRYIEPKSFGFMSWCWSKLLKTLTFGW